MIAVLLFTASVIASGVNDEFNCDSRAHHYSAADNYQIAWRTIPETIQVSEPFSVNIAVCVDDKAYSKRLKLDAVMPLHKHGMNLKPKVIMHSPGRFTAEGMMFHMKGQWEFRFTVKKAAGSQILTSEYRLK